jgi:hypothetical protein
VSRQQALPALPNRDLFGRVCSLLESDPDAENAIPYLDLVNEVEGVVEKTKNKALVQSVSEQEAAVLKAMLQLHPQRVTVEILTEILRSDEKSLRSYLKSLEALHLVTKPHGKTGRALTEAGLLMAQLLPENAGARLFRQKTR